MIVSKSFSSTTYVFFGLFIDLYFSTISLAVILAFFLKEASFNSSAMSIFSVFLFFSAVSTIFLNFFSRLILSYFFIIFLAAFLLFSIETGTFIFPSGVSTSSILTISPGILYFLASLIFLYFSLIFFAAICAFFPGLRLEISSNTSIVSFISSFTFGLHSFIFKYGFFIFSFLAFDARFSFLKSVESISLLVKCPASGGILFVFSFLGGIKI